MSKVFQVVDGFCYYDASALHDSVASVPDGLYPSSLILVDAPDYVREGWGYLDGEFVEPTPPEGWLYDPVTGTFYEDPNYVPPESEKSDMLAALELLGVTDDG